jgi:serine O-acetyltransferase
MNNALSAMLKREEERYKENFSNRDWTVARLTNDPQYMLWRYHKLMRCSEHYYNCYKSSINIISKIFYIGLFVCIKKRRNKIGNLLSVDIRENSFQEGLLIYHNNIVVNGHARIGKNCRLHGNNTIGNDGKSSGTPRIGDNVEVGVGAIVIGEIEIANDIKIGAGAVVNKSFTTPGVTLVGIPAKEVDR